MAAATQVAQSSASSCHQQTSGSTAPVLEYVCLFTRDLRRKQKRWQDGRLKYHTFNKRIMVYDERGNFIGDTHWHEDYDFDEGEEVELDRGGVIVQVSEFTGSRDQDLSELVDKRTRERAERQSAALARRPPTVESAIPNVAAPHFQLRHKPLHNLIGTPTGHHGRALMPSESPYEERQKQTAPTQDSDARSAKRRKREISPPSKSGYAQSLFGASLTLSCTPTSSPLLRSRPPQVISISAEHRPLSTISNIHDGRPNAASKMMNGSTTRVQEDLRGNTSKCALPEGAPRDTPVATTRGYAREQSPLPTSGDKADVPNQRVPPISIKNSRSNRTGHTREDAVEIDTLQPISADLGSKIQAHHKRPQPQHVGRPNDIHDTALEVDTINTGAESLPSISGPKESSRNQGRAIKPKPKSKTEGVSSNKEILEFAREQPISETRTELRIKPRKKRGLVMVSEKLNSDSSSTSRTSKDQIGYQDLPALPSATTKGDSSGDMSSGDTNIETSVKDPNRARQGARNTSLHDFPQANSKLTYKQDTERKKDQRKRASAGYDEDSQVILDPDSQRSQMNDKRARLSSSECEDGVLTEATRPSRSRKESSGKKKKLQTRDNVEDVFAPRLAQLGSKSVRSKEIIGFISDEEIDTNLARDFSADRNINALEAVSRSPQRQNRPTSARVSGNSDVQVLLSDDTAATRLPAAKMVVNPATRGKKAAKPSDAAGHVPQCPLPSEVAFGRPLDAKRYESNVPKTRPEVERKASAATMSGFSRANGGPWSREAHDLFEFTRPP
ncbi:hypothetical protein F5Y11DRAFT_153862 [Daldinia sp. FL1419]|nr:hypothetical protein F5Y11DRAFT_153862 [Daldinia sp. FL1419]